MSIRILRLKTGDDIIAEIDGNSDVYYVNSPMLIWMDQNQKTPKLCMDHWLPVQVVEENSVVLRTEDVLTEFYPNEQLEEYYINTVKEFNSVLDAKEMADRMSDEELIDTILAMQEGSGSTFH